jgi:hypothetical protein
VRDHSWHYILTVCCIVIAAVIEALEQALSQAPQVATHLPSFGGNWHFVPLGLLIIALISWFAGRRKPQPNRSAETNTGIELFENRDDLNARSGGLQTELARVRHALVMWPAGGSAVPVVDERLLNIKKLLLMNPNLQSGEYATTFRSHDATTVQNGIKDLSRRAQRLKIPVRWYPYPYLSVIINDPSSDTAWARIEILLPGLQGGHRPSIKIMKSSHRRLFENLVQMYDFMWEKSREPIY